MSNIPLTLSEDLSIPLCLDLDGTLIREDTTRTAAFRYIGNYPMKWVNPESLWQIAWWFLKGRHAFMKHKLAEHISLFTHKWTFSQNLIALALNEKKRGRPIFMVSATDHRFAQTLANTSELKPLFTHKDQFLEDHIIATNGLAPEGVNLRSEFKGEYLRDRFGEGQFIYAGNSKDDFKVWQYGATPIIAVYPENRQIAQRLSKQYQNTHVIVEMENS